MTSLSQTPTRVGGICQSCHLGELYQYIQDELGKLRCGRCGEPEAVEEPPAATTRKKAA
jgi:hypothetical protein